MINVDALWGQQPIEDAPCFDLRKLTSHVTYLDSYAPSVFVVFNNIQTFPGVEVKEQVFKQPRKPIFASMTAKGPFTKVQNLKRSPADWMFIYHQLLQAGSRMLSYVDFQGGRGDSRAMSSRGREGGTGFPC